MLMCAFGLMYVSFYAGTLWGKACSKASDPTEVGLTTDEVPVTPGELVVISASPPPFLEEVIVQNTTPISHSFGGKAFRQGSKCKIDSGRTAKVVEALDSLVLLQIDKTQYSLRFGYEGSGPNTTRTYLAGASLYQGRPGRGLDSDHCPVGTYFTKSLEWLKSRRVTTKKIRAWSNEHQRDRDTEYRLLRQAGLIED